MHEPTTCSYDLDDALRIVGVGAGWSEFAAANQASDLVPPPGPVGRSVLDAIADRTSVQLYERLFARVRRSGAPVTIPIRCDAPDRRRFLDLTISPRRPEGLRVETTLRRSEARPAVALLDASTPRADDRLVMCGWCKSVELEGRWVEVEEAVAELRLFERERLPWISHGICPTCTDRVFGAIDDEPAE